MSVTGEIRSRWVEIASAPGFPAKNQESGEHSLGLLHRLQTVMCARDGTAVKPLKYGGAFRHS